MRLFLLQDVIINLLSASWYLVSHPRPEKTLDNLVYTIDK